VRERKCYLIMITKQKALNIKMFFTVLNYRVKIIKNSAKKEFIIIKKG